MKMRAPKTFSAGTFLRTNRYRFSEEKEKFLLLENGYLEVRNSDTLVLKLEKIDLIENRKSNLVQIQIAPKDTLKQLAQLIKE